MSQLDRIINIQIDRQTTPVPQKGFGVMLLLVTDDALKPVGQTTRVAEYDQTSFKDDFTSGVVFNALTAFFSQDLVPEKVLVGYVEGVETIAEALAAIDDERSDWYALATTSRTLADQEACALYVSTQRRISGHASADAEMLNPASVGDLAKSFADNSRFRSFSFYNSEAATKYPEIAWMGRCLPADPGSLTWKFKSLVGIVSDALTGAQRTALRDKNANYYNEVGGVDITEEGWMGDGSFIDEIRGVDWLHARLQEAIFARLINLPKVPYTDQGVDLIINEMEGVMRRAVNQGILVDGSVEIIKPVLANISFNDRASRILPDIKFNALLQGAVHEIKIQGVVTV